MQKGFILGTSFLLITMIGCRANEVENKRNTTAQNESGDIKKDVDHSFQTTLALPQIQGQKLLLQNAIDTIFNIDIKKELNPNIKIVGSCTKFWDYKLQNNEQYGLDFRLYTPPTNYVGSTKPLIHTNSLLFSEYQFKVPANCNIITLKITGLTLNSLAQIAGEITYIASEEKLLYFGASPQFKANGQAVSLAMQSPQGCGDTCTIFTDENFTPPSPEPVIIPTVDFIASQTSANSAPLNVLFTDKTNVVADTWAWDFNNDGIIDSTLQNPTFNFQSSGAFSVKLDITKGGKTYSAIKQNYININSTTTPTVDFVASSTASTSSPFTVNFTDKSNFAGETWQWDFNNDGVIDSTTKNPTYTYQEKGTYTVKLNVASQEKSYTTTKQNYINISTTQPNPATETKFNVYVAPNGSDTSGDGTKEKPWKSIVFALTKAVPSTTIFLEPGTYSEYLRVKNSGTADAPIILAGTDPNNKPILKNPNPTVTENIYHSASFFTYRNLKMDGNGAGHSSDVIIHCLLVQPQSDFTLDVTNVTIDNLEVYNCSGYGILFQGKSKDKGAIFRRVENSIVKNTHIYNTVLHNIGHNKLANGWKSALRTGLLTRNITFEKNLVHNNWGEGLTSGQAENIKFINNISYDNSAPNFYTSNAVNVHYYRNLSYCTEDFKKQYPNIKIVGFAIGEENYDQWNDFPWGNRRSNVNIINNISYNCNSNFVSFGAEVGTGGLRNSIIANNTFWNADNIGMIIENGINLSQNNMENSVRVFNNIVHSKTTGREMRIYGDHEMGNTKTTPMITIDHNFYVGGEPFQWSNIQNKNIYPVTGVGDIVGQSPAFNGTPSQSAESYMLKADSPAKGKGKLVDDLEELKFDFNGSARGTNRSMGAFN